MHVSIANSTLLHFYGQDDASVGANTFQIASSLGGVGSIDDVSANLMIDVETFSKSLKQGGYDRQSAVAATSFCQKAVNQFLSLSQADLRRHDVYEREITQPIADRTQNL